MKTISNPRSPDRNNPMDPWASKYESVNSIEETWSEDPALNKYLKSKGLDPRYVSRAQMISNSKLGDFDKWKRDHYSSARITHDMIESTGMSKSARMIKAIYKYHRMKKEEVCLKGSDDKDIDDKTITTYGKKPKFDTTKEKDSLGDNKPKARAILSGGTTLTGEKRDIVEFDPELAARTSSPDKITVDKNGKTKDNGSTK